MPVRFAIVTHKRSGTHMLSSALARHPDVANINEIFNLTDPDRTPPPDKDRSDEILRRLHAINWCNPVRHTGFILHFDQDREWGVLEFLKQFNCKYVCLTRLNQLARLVSVEQVLLHNKWQCHDVRKVPKCHQVGIKPSEFIRETDEVANDWAGFMNLVPPEERKLYTYEQMCDDTTATIKDVCGFLGIDYHDIMAPRTVKTTTLPLADIVTNYNELWSMFRGRIYDSVQINDGQDQFAVPAVKLVPNPVVGEGQHHSGWPYAMANLRRYHTDNGMLFDDYVDRSFGYQRKYVPYSESWLGIIHHPTDASSWVKEKHILPNIVDTDQWRQSAPFLKGLICLSDHSRRQVEDCVDVPTFTVRHPTCPPSKMFTWAGFLDNPVKRALQVGYYCRNTLAITQLPKIPGFVKTRVWDNSVKWIRARDRSLQLAYSGVRPYLDVTEHWDRLDNEEYDDALSKNVVFLEIFTASANNVVVECIVRNTPVVVNRLPALEEYLGKDYPLFYDDFYEAPKLFDLRKIQDAYEYLRQLDKTPYHVDTFVSDIMRIVRTVNQ
jgi:hypothetical protein